MPQSRRCDDLQGLRQRAPVTTRRTLLAVRQSRPLTTRHTTQDRPEACSEHAQTNRPRVTCPRCAGLVVQDMDTTMVGFPVYCVNCGWHGRSQDEPRPPRVMIRTRVPQTALTKRRISESMRAVHVARNQAQREEWRARISASKKSPPPAST